MTVSSLCSGTVAVETVKEDRGVVVEATTADVAASVVTVTEVVDVAALEAVPEAVSAVKRMRARRR